MEVLEESILIVDLVAKTYQCLNLMTKCAFQQSRRVGSTKMFSFKGTFCQRKYIKVNECNNTLSKKYFDLPQHLDEHCLLLSNNFVYRIGGCIETIDGCTFV